LSKNKDTWKCFTKTLVTRCVCWLFRCVFRLEKGTAF